MFADTVVHSKQRGAVFHRAIVLEGRIVDHPDKSEHRSDRTSPCARPCRRPRVSSRKCPSAVRQPRSRCVCRKRRDRRGTCRGRKKPARSCNHLPPSRANGFAVLALRAGPKDAMLFDRLGESRLDALRRRLGRGGDRDGQERNTKSCDERAHRLHPVPAADRIRLLAMIIRTKPADVDFGELRRADRTPPRRGDKAATPRDPPLNGRSNPVRRTTARRP